jgi:hypothetical protein
MNPSKLKSVAGVGLDIVAKIIQMKGVKNSPVRDEESMCIVF